MLPIQTYLIHYFIAVLVFLAIFVFTRHRCSLQAINYITLGVLLVLPIGYFFYILFVHSVNIPFTDDYELLKTFYTLITSLEPIEKLQAFFEQLNEHRLVFERFILLMIYFVEGTQNIKSQILIGNLFLFGILFLFYRFHRSEGHSPVSFLAIPFFIFNLIYYENIIWGITAMQNTSVLFFAMLSFFYLSLKNNFGFFGAILSTIIVTFVLGSGVSVWVIGLFILVLQNRFKFSFFWTLIGSGVILFYFTFDYYFFNSARTALFKFPFRNIIYALGFYGNAFYLDIPHPAPSTYYPDVFVAVGAGAALVLICLWFISRIFAVRPGTLKWTYWFLAGNMLFVLATGAMLVLSRPVQFNIIWGGEVFSRRYMIFGVVLLVAGYLAVLTLLKRRVYVQRIFVYLTLGLAIILNMGSYYLYLHKVRAHRENLVLDPYYLRTHRMLLTSGEAYGDQFFWNHPTMMTELLSNLKKTGIYTFPVHPLTNVKPNLASLTDMGPAPMESTVRMIAKKETAWAGVIKDRFTIRLKMPPEYPKAPAYLAFRSKCNLFLVPALAEPNTLPDFLRTGHYYSNSYSYSFWRGKFLPDRYDIWLLYVDASGRWSRSATGKQVQL
jgi:hypothetical protein